ncbi:MAG: translation elongation factor Ts, partial [Eubacterium sp.]|nr:translation elongation factor Ts [Eubacterium sp.]
AAEGIVKTFISEDGKKASMVEVNSETDFVAKNDKFQDFVGDVVEQINGSEAEDVEAFLAEAWAKDSSKTVKEELASMVATIGENMNIRRFAKLSAENGMVVDYIHAGGKIGVLIAAETDNTGDEVVECLKNVAMQIAAMNPEYLSADDVSEEYKEKEKKILLEQAKNDPKNAGKPENIIEKMIIGRLNKELKEVCLTEQVYVKAENKETVAKYVESVAKAVGCNLKLTGFVRYETGEGLEKKEEDFAAEVAAQMNA